VVTVARLVVGGKLEDRAVVVVLVIVVVVVTAAVMVLFVLMEVEVFGTLD
jgi:hypothetical protein